MSRLALRNLSRLVSARSDEVKIQDLCEALTKAAYRYLELGRTSTEIFEQAKKDKITEMNISADYVACIAGIMEIIEKERR